MRNFKKTVIDALLNWASKKDRAVAIIICDKNETQLAWKNLDKLNIDGASMLAYTPAGFAFHDVMNTAVDCLREGIPFDEEFIDKVNQIPVNEKSYMWVVNQLEDEKK